MKDHLHVYKILVGLNPKSKDVNEKLTRIIEIMDGLSIRNSTMDYSKMIYGLSCENDIKWPI